MSDTKTTFTLGVTLKPFLNLKAAQEAGDEIQFDAMTSAIAMAFGLDSETVVVDAFESEMKAARCRAAVDEYSKSLSGHTIGGALISKMRAGHDIAEDAKGTVSFGIVFVPGKDGKPDTATVQVRFGGISGVTASRAGGGRRGSYDYFDNGTLIGESLKKYLLATYPDSHASMRIKAHASGEKKGNVSAWVATEDGMKKGDPFVITRADRAETTESAKDSNDS